MNRVTVKSVCAAGFLLTMTIQATATGATAADGRSAAGGDGGRLRVVQAQPGEPRKIFRGVGVVTAIEPTGALTINHEPIEGLMPAMEMTFSVNPRTLSNGVRPGDRVAFSVEGKTYVIVGLKVVGHTE
jgi:Cu/Ag efflux protein CusF